MEKGTKIATISSKVFSELEDFFNIFLNQTGLDYGYRQVWLIWKLGGHTHATYQTYLLGSGGTSPELLAEQCQHLRLLSVSSYVWAENRIGTKSQQKHF